MGARGALGRHLSPLLADKKMQSGLTKQAAFLKKTILFS